MSLSSARELHFRLQETGDEVAGTIFSLSWLSVNVWEAGMAHWWKGWPPTNDGRVRFWPGVICGLSLLLVLASCSEGFFLWVLQFFLPSQKPTSPNSSSTRIENTSENHLRLSDAASSLNIVIYLFYFKVQLKDHHADIEKVMSSDIPSEYLDLSGFLSLT